MRDKEKIQRYLEENTFTMLDVSGSLVLKKAVRESELDDWDVLNNIVEDSMGVSNWTASGKSIDTTTNVRKFKVTIKKF